MESKKAVLILAPGFEETEAISTADVLRRGGVELVLAGIDQSDWVESTHGVRIGLDTCLKDVSINDQDVLVLPGGMPGARKLAESEEVIDAVKKAAAGEILIGAICAAPIVLAAAGVLRGRRVTCFPGFDSELADGIYTGNRLENDDGLVTAVGPGAALEFGLALLRELGLEREAVKLADGMMVRQ